MFSHDSFSRVLYLFIVSSIHCPYKYARLDITYQTHHITARLKNDPYIHLYRNRCATHRIHTLRTHTLLYLIQRHGQTYSHGLTWSFSYTVHDIVLLQHKHTMVTVPINIALIIDHALLKQ